MLIRVMHANANFDEYEKLGGAWKGNIDCYKEKGIEFQEKSDGIYIKKSDKDDAIRYCS